MTATADRSGPGLRFRDLGTLVVERDGTPLPLGGPRLTSALAMLLIHADERVGTGALTEAVWGTKATPRSQSTLESHVWRLRKLLEPDRAHGAPSTVLLHDVAGYRLLATVDQVDSLRFTQLVGEAADLLAGDQPDRALQRTTDALALWRGRPFTSVADEAWAQAAVARLEELHRREGSGRHRRREPAAARRPERDAGRRPRLDTAGHPGPLGRRVRTLPGSGQRLRRVDGLRRRRERRAAERDVEEGVRWSDRMVS